MELKTGEATELISLDPEVCVRKRAFAGGILLMNYAILRFADVRRLRSPEADDDSANGALLSSRTKKHHGQNWPPACPRTGLTGATDWIQQIANIRAAYRRVTGATLLTHSRVSTRSGYSYPMDPPRYGAKRRKLAPMRTGLGDANGDDYTLRPPNNLIPTEANQMSFGQRELAIIGHWSITSRIPERYDRTVGSVELLLRNTIVHQIVAGWDIAPSYHLPATVSGHLRIGKTEGRRAPAPPATRPTDGERESASTKLPTAHTARLSITRNLTHRSKSRKQTALVETDELILTQNTTQKEPKTDVLALGTQALGDPNFKPNTLTLNQFSLTRSSVWRLTYGFCMGGAGPPPTHPPAR